MEVQTNDDFPFEIKDLDPIANNELLMSFTGERNGYIRVGPKGYILRQKYKKDARNIYNMTLKSTDVFVLGYPRSGTTWTQELVWMVANDLDYATSDAIPLFKRFRRLEGSFDLNRVMKDKLREQISEEKLEVLKMMSQPGIQKLAASSSPRFIKTHVPLSLLPPTLLDTARCVYVARDPRDVAVSYYFLSKHARSHAYVGDFKTYWNYFLKNLILWTPFFEHLKEAWEQRHNPNLHFLFYEELSMDLPSTVRRVANFFNEQFTEEKITSLCDHLSFDNFKNNSSGKYDEIKKLFFFNSSEDPYIRKGKMGGWREYFDEDMSRQAESWMADNLRNTDLQFPHLDN